MWPLCKRFNYPIFCPGLKVLVFSTVEDTVTDKIVAIECAPYESNKLGKIEWQTLKTPKTLEELKKW